MQHLVGISGSSKKKLHLQREMNWIGGNLPNLSKNYSPQQHPGWHIRLTIPEFHEWRINQAIESLHFDGASKNNPGKAGAGGILRTSDGTIRIKYSWGLGICSNNTAEALALWKGCQIAKDHGINKLNVFGDSLLIFGTLNANTNLRNLALNQIIQRIKQISSTFTDFKVFHILRNLNEDADREANVGVNLGCGILISPTAIVISTKSLNRVVILFRIRVIGINISAIVFFRIGKH